MFWRVPTVISRKKIWCTLYSGIETLRKNDKDIDALFALRGAEILQLLERYVKEIELFNPAYGLVGVNDTGELIIRHILDSLAPLGIITRKRGEKEFSAADAGSGAGLPGIPLAIVLSNCKFTLIERMGRRAGFLLNTKAALGLSNITVLENELENAARDESMRFDLITFRAFKPLEPKLLKTLFKACKPGGIIAAYKGKRAKIEEEILNVKRSDINMTWEAVPYTVPFLDEERHLLFINPK